MASEDFLDKKLNERKEQRAFRQLQQRDGLIDFCSNDYLGVVKNGLLNKESRINAATKLPADNAHHSPHSKFIGPATDTEEIVLQPYDQISGATGSRLLSGNYPLIEQTEKLIAQFHQTESALIFNSGYDANIGLFSTVPQKGDTIIYDELSHASIRDGIRLSFAQAWSFKHNDIEDLTAKLQKAKGSIFVATESVFSMDGDLAALPGIVNCCQRFNAHLIVDEAHSTGVIGERGEGLVQELKLSDCFARVHTFGKALGAHGAAIVGSAKLRDYLINFSRPLIYTTALPPAAVWSIKKAYELLPGLVEERKKLNKLIESFHQIHSGFQLIKTPSAIQAAIVPGNARVKMISSKLADRGIDVRPILSPTVPAGTERLRIVLHSFNTIGELKLLVEGLNQELNEIKQ